MGLVAALSAELGCKMTAVFSPMRNKKLPSGLVKTKTTVCASGVEMWLMLLNTAPLALLVLFSALARSKLNLTAAESKAAPS